MNIAYRDSTHEELPHVVRFSGGRSSALMSFELARSGALRPERGDVILFANTSAEHPDTYEFAAECKKRLERDHGLPFFWYEFCTVEDASKGAYVRRQSYRLVVAEPVESNPDGYRSAGEVFEEFLSYQGMLPTPMSRSCTAKLKLYPQHLLLAEWLSGSDGPSHRGHHADRRFLDPDAAVRLYQRNGGAAEIADYRKRVEFMTSRPPARGAQSWRDFTGAELRPHAAGPRAAQLWGRGAARFVTLLGLRADEPQRVKRVLSRSFFAEDAPRRKCSVRTQPPGERPYFPLSDAGVSAADVAGYWRGRDFDLACPEQAGNCVFCFMKGTAQLAAAGRAPDPRRVDGAPSDIGWWADIERRYRQERPRRDGAGTSRFGFLGVSGPTFAQLAAGDAGGRSRFATGGVACDCTD